MLSHISSVGFLSEGDHANNSALNGTKLGSASLKYTLPASNHVMALSTRFILFFFAPRLKGTIAISGHSRRISCINPIPDNVFSMYTLLHCLKAVLHRWKNSMQNFLPSGTSHLPIRVRKRYRLLSFPSPQQQNNVLSPLFADIPKSVVINTFWNSSGVTLNVRIHSS